MIVCVCNNISDREIRQAVQLGVRSMVQLRNELGVGTCCGKCQGCAKQVLRESLQDPENTGTPPRILINA